MPTKNSQRALGAKFWRSLIIPNIYLPTIQSPYFSCCDVGGDGVPRNPSSKKLPVAMKHVHSLQAANIASSPRQASVLHLARQALFEPNGSRHITNRQASSSQHLARPTHSPTSLTAVDNLATELFVITLSDHKADLDSHSKLWVSRLEVQWDKGKSYSLDATANLVPGLTLDDAQHITCALQAAEIWCQSRAQVTLNIVELQMARARARIFTMTSRDVLRLIQDELTEIIMTLKKVKHKVSTIVSCRSRLEALCHEMCKLLINKEAEIPVLSELFEFDSSHHYNLPINYCDKVAQLSLFLGAVSVVIFGIGHRQGEFLMEGLSLILSLAMEVQNIHSESHHQHTLAQIPRSMETALSHFKLNGQTTTYAVCPACNCTYKPMANINSSDP
ncbi:hypothetical protein BDR07DRAFT_1381429 [Suillus spraguei]|nr:hypothetical protein BDR07DRAFT_1381429 [Suillus spraguei]